MSPPDTTRGGIGIVGGGAWGIALALAMARAGREVRIWLRDPATLGPDRRLPRLPGHRLPEGVRVSAELPDAAIVLLAVPTQALRTIATRLHPAPGTALIACCKGLEQGSMELPGDILAGLHPACRIGALSGPNFAHEVADGLPAAAVLAMADAQDAASLAQGLSTPGLRLYASDDPVGVQLGGAAKNVIAIAAGIAIGAALGENARAALVTRGIAELSRLVAALGGQPATAAGLSGIGDLLLTCTGTASRNFSLGVALGRGDALATILAGRTTVAEGVATAPALLARARAAGIEMPIVETVDALLAGRLTVPDAVTRLMRRPLGRE